MPFEICSADGQTIQVQDGEWYVNTTARCRRLMLNSLSSEARRVYACLELATIRFKREEALVKQPEGYRYLTSTDIKNHTGLEERQVRRGLVELETEGLAQRVPIKGDTLQNGNIKILCWATPRVREKAGDPDARVRVSSIFPDHWQTLKELANRLKLTISEEEAKAISPNLLQDARDPLSGQLEEAGRVLNEAQKEAARLLRTLCARAAINKDARNESTTTERRGEEKEPPPPPMPPEVKSNGHQTAVAVVTAPNSETIQRFEQWRMIRNQCKKPVPDENLELRRQCFEVFAAYSPPEQERIIVDTANRTESWNAEVKLQFIPDALKYLRDAVWRTDPVQHVPKRTSREEQRRQNEAELMRRARLADEELNRRRQQK